MTIMKISVPSLSLPPMENFDDDIEKCLDVLRSGGTILYPTDTVWGLGCDATDPVAVDKIFEVKQRPASSSMIILLADERDILKYVAGIDLQVFDYLASVTKPTTVIYPGAIGLADNVINKDGSIGIRLVKDEFCKHLIKRFRKPIVSTSANISGQPTPAKFADIDERIKNNVDYVVKYRQHETAEAAASAIVKWNGVNDITIIRK
ncbi:L-threonylcarbamoyladenylate synthase [Pinibacter aurantiacus]|nr:L-threonylcarbamoyladenylate synthase [Pinibacter aurantiacus]